MKLCAMKNSYYKALVALTILFISLPVDTFAGRTARRAAEMCKSEACDGGDPGSGPLVAWYIGIPLFIAILWLWSNFEDRSEK
jgi:hypothetical protein